MERPYLLSTIALATVIAFTAGCESNPVPVPPAKVIQVTSTPPVPTAGVEDSNINRFYPELRGLPLKERSAVTNQFGNVIEIYNFTDVEIDLDAARQRFNYFGGFVSRPQTFESSLEGWTFYIEASARPRNPSIPFFIIPKDTPPSSAGTDKPILAYGATLIEKGIAQASYVRVDAFNPFPDVEEALNHAISVETCQALARVEVRYIDPPPSNINPVDLINDAQENFCNVWSRYFSVKQMEILYNQVKVPSFPNIRSRLIQITESLYNNMPKIPKIARVR